MGQTENATTHERYVITHIDDDGIRRLTFARNAACTYLIRENAEQACRILKPQLRSRGLGNRADTLAVRAVPCYRSGSPTTWWFEDDAADTTTTLWRVRISERWERLVMVRAATEEEALEEAREGRYETEIRLDYEQVQGVQIVSNDDN